MVWVCLCVCFYPLASLYIYLSLHSSVYVFIYPSVHRSIYMYLSISLFLIYLSIYRSISLHLTIYSYLFYHSINLCIYIVSIYPFISLSIYLHCIYLSIHQSIYLHVHVSIYPFISLSICIVSIYPSISLSIYNSNSEGWLKILNNWMTAGPKTKDHLCATASLIPRLVPSCVSLLNESLRLENINTCTIHVPLVPSIHI